MGNIFFKKIFNDLYKKGLAISSGEITIFNLFKKILSINNTPWMSLWQEFVNHNDEQDYIKKFNKFITNIESKGYRILVVIEDLDRLNIDEFIAFFSFIRLIKQDNNVEKPIKLNILMTFDLSSLNNSQKIKDRIVSDDIFNFLNKFYDVVIHISDYQINHLIYSDYFDKYISFLKSKNEYNQQILEVGETKDAIVRIWMSGFSSQYVNLRLYNKNIINQILIDSIFMEYKDKIKEEKKLGFSPEYYFFNLIFYYYYIRFGNLNFIEWYNILENLIFDDFELFVNKKYDFNTFAVYKKQTEKDNVENRMLEAKYFSLTFLETEDYFKDYLKTSFDLQNNIKIKFKKYNQIFTILNSNPEYLNFLIEIFYIKNYIKIDFLKNDKLNLMDFNLYFFNNLFDEGDYNINLKKFIYQKIFF